MFNAELGGGGGKRIYLHGTLTRPHQQFNCTKPVKVTIDRICLEIAGTKPINYLKIVFQIRLFTI